VRALALGWLAGTLWLQTRADLPPTLLSYLLLAIGALALGCVALSAMRSRILLSLLLLLAGASLGAGWSAQLAQHRLAEALPAELEGRDLQLTGIVASLPNRFQDGQRFVFEVESASDGSSDVSVPSRIALGWYAAEQSAPVLIPGQRWQFTARLKQPHGQLNPDVFDAEAWWLTEGIRANGYVRQNPALLLDDFVVSARDLVGRARHSLRERIQQALP
jgi:competence protein ComEC